ncbi:LOW QUALITY PROTEIN: hypothetical protein U9M48_004632 [Paspalum notatum var. saurae]|uniref:Uncharacterized protein n=1 Tax=Paspalum notatum var. saurae TaxID=547442 RepID=A0AAQ3PKS8_PASNO
MPGSSHNFFDEIVARYLGLALHPRQGICVTVGNGERITCPGMFPDTPIEVGAECFLIDCYAMPVGGYDFILGVSFLVTLRPRLWDFLNRYCVFAITSASFGLVLTAPIHQPQRVCRLTGLLGTNAVAVHPYRYSHIQKEELKHQCAEMQHQGVIHPNTFAFSSLALLVKKHDGTWRLCIDYRALNSKTVKDKFPIPVVEEFVEELNGANFFTKLDLRSCYHQVLMALEDTAKTAFRTHQGMFEFLVMPFGLMNAPATFQALINLPFLRRFVLVFCDYILIYNFSRSEHLRHVRLVVRTLQEYRPFLKRSRRWLTWDMPYSSHGWRKGPCNSLLADTNLSLGSARQVTTVGLSRTTALTAPLTKLLRKEGFCWMEDAAAAFSALQQALTTAPILQLPDFSNLFIVECDASGFGFGAVLHQGSGAIAFFSRPIAAPHMKLAAYELELIVLVQAMKHCVRACGVVSSSPEQITRLSTIPQHQWASKLIGFDFRVEFKPSHANVVADSLSRRDSTTCAALSALQFALFDEICQAIVEDQDLEPAPEQGCKWT